MATTRIVSYLLVVVLALLLLLPGALGVLAQQQLPEQMARIQSGSLQLRMQEYERGWFSSKMVTVSDLDTDFGIQTLIDHGPIRFQPPWFVGLYATRTRVADARYEVGTETAQLLAETGMGYLLEVTTQTGFFGDLTFDADIPAASADRGTQGAVEFSGLQAKGSFDPSTGAVQAAGVAGDLFIRGEEGQLQLTGLTFAADGELLDSALLLGTSQLSVQQLSAEPCETCLGDERENYQFALDGLELLGSSFEADGLLSFDIEKRARRIKVGTTAITDLQLLGRTERVSKAAVDRYSQLIDQLDEPAADQVTDPVTGTQMMNELPELVQDFLSHEPGLVLDPLTFDYDELPFKLTMDLRVVAPPTGSAQAATSTLAPGADFDVTQLMGIADQVRLAADLEFAQQLAHKIANAYVRQELTAAGVGDAQKRANIQTPMLLEALVQKGYLKKEAEQYRVALGFTNGNLTINGEVFPLAAIVGAAMFAQPDQNK